MDIQKILDQLSHGERKALLERLLEEDGAKRQDDLDVEKRLQRLEKAIQQPIQGFAPWKMMPRMPGRMAPPFMGGSGTAKPARIFNALADETRLKIVGLLGQGEKSVEQLMQALGISQSNTSHHLRILRDSELVESRKEGSRVYYSLSQALRGAVLPGGERNLDES